MIAIPISYPTEWYTRGIWQNVPFCFGPAIYSNSILMPPFCFPVMFWAWKNVLNNYPSSPMEGNTDSVCPWFSGKISCSIPEQISTDMQPTTEPALKAEVAHLKIQKWNKPSDFFPGMGESFHLPLDLYRLLCLPKQNGLKMQRWQTHSEIFKGCCTAKSNEAMSKAKQSIWHTTGQICCFTAEHFCQQNSSSFMCSFQPSSVGFCGGWGSTVAFCSWWWKIPHGCLLSWSGSGCPSWLPCCCWLPFLYCLAT